MVEGDAGTSDAYAGAVPADLVLACGIFGNISDARHRAHDPLPAVAVRAGRMGAVDPPPARPRACSSACRAGWSRSGLEPIEVEVADDATFGVGANRLVVDPPPFEPGQHLFTFIR